MRVLRRLVILAAVAIAQPAMAAPQVVATIAPLHSLVAAVMVGVGEPTLLLPGNASPHAYTMRPSQARMLADADMVVWVGPQLETFLEKPLATLGGRARVVAMAEVAGILRLPVREGGIWEEDSHDDHDHGGHGHEAEEAYDAHLWLDPSNARALAETVAKELAVLDPDNAPAYRRNLDSVTRELDALDAEIQDMLSPVKTRPFLVFHDAYQYFEHRYGLSPIGSITVAADRQPGARRIAAIRDRIHSSGTKCLFREPQFASRIIEPITQGLPVRLGILDPLGGSVPSGPKQYPAMMRALAQAAHACLSTPD